MKDLGDERSRKEGFTTGGIRDTEDYMDCRAGGMQDRGGVGRVGDLCNGAEEK